MTHTAVDTTLANQLLTRATHTPVSFFLVPPWDHQREAFERAKNALNFGLFFEMGAGKTMTAINILRWKYSVAGRVLRTLVVTPPVVVQNWKREFQQHSKVGEKVICLEGTGKQRAALLMKHSKLPTIFVTNYETLLMSPCLQILSAWEPEAIVFDESHKLKNISAKRTKRAIYLADMARIKLILTGTPVLNTPLDLFAQFRVMDGGKTFGANFYAFRAEYFYDKNAGMTGPKKFALWLPRPGTIDKLNAKIKPVSMVVKKADCLDLPPLVKQEIAVELSPTQRKLYETMKKDFVVYMGDKACVAPLAITKALRLQQIVSGFITMEGENGEDRSNVAIKDNPRAKALGEVLSDIAPYHKVLVWAVFRENYATVRKVCEELELPYVELHGEVSPAARQKAVDSFNTDPAVRVFLGHPGSAGIGINLVSASYSIFYSRTFSLEQDLQAEARNYRGGSEIHDKVTRIDLVAKGTIDEIITSKLAAKIDMSEQILREIAEQL